MNFAAIEAAIANTVASNGWLIFSTHDVAEEPTSYGVTPEFFAQVLEAAVASGAVLCPVAAGLRAIGVAPRNR